MLNGKPEAFSLPQTDKSDFKFAFISSRGVCRKVPVKSLRSSSTRQHHGEDVFPASAPHWSPVFPQGPSPHAHPEQLTLKPELTGLACWAANQPPSFSFIHTCFIHALELSSELLNQQLAFLEDNCKFLCSCESVGSNNRFPASCSMELTTHLHNEQACAPVLSQAKWKDLTAGRKRPKGWGEKKGNTQG